MMKYLIAAMTGLALVLTAGCDTLKGGATSTEILSTRVDMVATSKAAYAARSSYFILLIVADKVKTNIPVCSATVKTDICITTAQLDVLKKTEASAHDLSLEGVKAVRTLGENPTAVAAAVAASQAAVAQFKVQTDIWADKVPKT